MTPLFLTFCGGFALCRALEEGERGRLGKAVLFLLLALSSVLAAVLP